MKIQQSSLQMAGASARQQIQISLQPDRSPTRPQPSAANASALGDVVALSPPPDADELEGRLRDAIEHHPLWRMVKQLVYLLTGDEIELPGGSEHSKASEKGEPNPPTRPAATPADEQATPRQPPSISLSIQQESVSFFASGKIETMDGRQIMVETGFSMERSQTTVDIRPANRKDPLVINFAASSANLQDSRISFDLDADGQAEQIAFLAAGSGFLVLDRNGDGKINDGGEMFGAQSGNGFADLAEYDEDGNGWIDENDAIWNKLLIWSQDNAGRQSLQSFKQTGVGALALQNAPTEFSLQHAAKEQGMLRRSGIFLFEDGRVGGLQQIDLNV